MASNPMQRKTRNAFLLGALVSLIICLLLGVLFYLLLSNPNNKHEMTKVAVLKTNLKAGDPITSSSFTEKEVYADLVPANRLTPEKIKTMIDSANAKKDNDNSNIQIVAAIDLSANSVITAGQILESEVTADTRYVEYNMLTMGTELYEGAFVDVRITFPNGLDLVVASKKRVETIKGTTIGFFMTEAEIDMMESAIVESYIMTASKIYLTQYVASTQLASSKTYVPTDEVKLLISNNPNIPREASDALNKRFDEGISTRNSENIARSAYTGLEIENIEAKTTLEIQNAKKAREDYLTSLQQATQANSQTVVKNTK